MTTSEGQTSERHGQIWCGSAMYSRVSLSPYGCYVEEITHLRLVDIPGRQELHFLWASGGITRVHILPIQID